LAMPSFRDSDSTRLRAAANLVLADLAFAQIESISHAADTRRFVVAADGSGYWIAAQSASTTPITNPQDRQPYKVTFGFSRAQALGGVRISTHNFGSDNALGFSAFGQPDQAAPSLTLTSGKRTITLTIDSISGEGATGAIQ